MASFSDTAKNNMLNNLDAGGSVYWSLHDGDPGETGLNEITGGSPAYARKLVTMAAASGGSMSPTAAVTFDVPVGDVAYVGLWDAISGGNFLCGEALPATETFANQGTLEVGTGMTISIPDA